MTRIASSLLLLVLIARIAAAQPAEPLPELPVDDSRRGTGAEERKADMPPAALEPLLGGTGSLVPGVAGAAGTAQADSYRDCLALIDDNPSMAIDRSFLWQMEGGGLPARHCLALALVAMERYGLAAERLTEVAEQLRLGRGLPAAVSAPDEVERLLAGLYGQIGNAWLLAGDPARAYTAFSQAIADVPAGDNGSMVELRIDRARSLAESGDFKGALEDLARARQIDARRPDVALYMASAHRALGDLASALGDVERAIELGGEGAVTLLERGNIRLLMGEEGTAREDWLAVAARWPESAAADAARANLEALDVEGDGG